MIWEEALPLIIQHIVVGTDLNPALQYRNVVAGPNYVCNTYDYNGSLGYSVQIGANNFIEIPLSMLEILLNNAMGNGGIYNNGVFHDTFPQQLNNHGCHVHVVGKIFQNAHIALPPMAGDYTML